MKTNTLKKFFKPKNKINSDNCLQRINIENSCKTYKDFLKNGSYDFNYGSLVEVEEEISNYREGWNNLLYYLDRISLYDYIHGFSQSELEELIIPKSDFPLLYPLRKYSGRFFGDVIVTNIVGASWVYIKGSRVIQFNDEFHFNPKILVNWVLSGERPYAFTNCYSSWVEDYGLNEPSLE